MNQKELGKTESDDECGEQLDSAVQIGATEQRWQTYELRLYCRAPFFRVTFASLCRSMYTVVLQHNYQMKGLTLPPPPAKRLQAREHRKQ